MHACFEQIAWLDDGQPDEELLRRKLQAMQLPQTNLAAIVARFRGALEKPGIRAILSRSAYAGGHRPEVWRERPFAIRHEEAILRGTFDRLVVLFDGEKAVGADILDFKSDSLDAGDPAAVEEKREFYRPQLEAYRTAVAKLYGLGDDRITTRLVFVEPGVIVVV